MFLNSFKGGQTSGQTENTTHQLSYSQLEMLNLISTDLKITRKQISDMLEIKKIQFIC